MAEWREKAELSRLLPEVRSLLEAGWPGDPVVERAFQEVLAAWPEPLVEAEAVILSQVNARGWEFASNFYRGSGNIRAKWGTGAFLRWGRLCLTVDRMDTKEALQLLRVGDGFWQGPKSEPVGILDQALALAHYHGRLASPFLKGLPELIRLAGPKVREPWFQEAERLAPQSWLGAEAYLDQTGLFLAGGGKDVVGWGEDGFALGLLDADLAAAFFRASTAAWTFVHLWWETWRNLIHGLAQAAPGLAKVFLQVCPPLVKRFPPSAIEGWVAEALRIHQAKGIPPAQAYLGSGPQILRDLSGESLRAWVTEGLHTAAATAYFALDSESAREGLRRLRQGVELPEVESTLRTLGEAILGEPVRIRSLDELPEEITPGLESLGDGVRIYLPANENSGEHRPSNLERYRQYFLHELAHLVYGTHQAFVLGEDLSTPYADALPEATDPTGFLAAFHAFEDARVAQRMREEYPGFSRYFPVGGGGKGSSCYDSLAGAKTHLANTDAESVRGGLLPQLSTLALAPALPAGATALEHRLWDRLNNFRREEVTAGHRAVRYYPEWDSTLGDYLPNWCKVGERVVTPRNLALAKRILEENHGLLISLKRIFTYFRPERMPRFFRQKDGNEPDIDGIMDEIAANNGVIIGDGLYIRREKNMRDVAVAVLLDLSESTNIPLDAGKSILDVEIEAVMIMAESLEELGDRYAIYGFHSDERLQVEFQVVKDFAEPFGETAQARFGNLKGYGATRLGAALRHATQKLRQQPAALHLLLVLSDGRPWDFDYHHTGKGQRRDDYPEVDCRVALQEARRQGVVPFCITIDSRGYQYLGDIFGPVGYQVVQEVAQLPQILPVIYRKLTC